MSVVAPTILDFRRIVLNLNFYFGSITKIKVLAKSRWMFHCKSCFLSQYLYLIIEILSCLHRIYVIARLNI